jgi:hypothetical protein
MKLSFGLSKLYCAAYLLKTFKYKALQNLTENIFFMQLGAKRVEAQLRINEKSCVVIYYLLVNKYTKNTGKSGHRADIVSYFRHLSFRSG